MAYISSGMADYDNNPWSSQATESSVWNQNNWASTQQNSVAPTSFAETSTGMVPSAQQQTPQTSPTQPAAQPWTGANMIQSGFSDQGSGGGISIPDRIRAEDINFQQRFGDEAYGMDNYMSLGDGYGQWSGANSINNNYVISHNDDLNWNDDHTQATWGGNRFALKVKSGDKVGSTIQYTKGDDGYFHPDASSRSQQSWNTNPTSQNLGMLRIATSILGGALMGPALEGAGAAISAGSMPTLSQIGSVANMFNTASGGQIPGLREIGMVGSLGGNLSGLADGVSNGINSFSDAAKLGSNLYGAYNKGSQMINMFSGPDEQYANQTYQPNRTPQYTGPGAVTSTGVDKWGNPVTNSYNPNMAYIQGGTGGGGATAGGSFLGNLAGSLPSLAAGIYGDARNRDAFQGLNDMASRAEMERQFYQNQLKDSYTNPDSFYNSNQWKGLESVYQNSIDRKVGAQGGRLANPTDREVLLQNYAMKELENYRNGLRGGLAANPLQADALARAMQYKAQSGAQTAAGAQYGGLAQTISRLLGGQNPQSVSPQTLASVVQQAYKLTQGFGGLDPGMGGASGNFDANYGVESPADLWGGGTGVTGQNFQPGDPYQASPFAGVNDNDSVWGDGSSFGGYFSGLGGMGMDQGYADYIGSDEIPESFDSYLNDFDSWDWGF